MGREEGNQKGVTFLACCRVPYLEAPAATRVDTPATARKGFISLEKLIFFKKTEIKGKRKNKIIMKKDKKSEGKVSITTIVKTFGFRSAARGWFFFFFDQSRISCLKLLPMKVLCRVHD